MPDAATARTAALSAVYNFASVLFADPAMERFENLQSPDLQKTLLACCEYLDPQLADEAAALLEASGDRETVKGEYARVFGHTLAVEAAPYELEYMENRDVFAQTQHLADIQGFYSAFGVRVTQGERADHIAVECEFLSHVLLKQTLAMERGDGEDAEVCALAFDDFWRDHFDRWTPLFAGRMQQKSDAAFYGRAAGFLLLTRRISRPGPQPGLST